MSKPKLTVSGRLDDPSFQQARLIAQSLADTGAVDVSFVQLVETDWEDFLQKIKKTRGGRYMSHARSPLCFEGKTYIGSEEELQEWATANFQLEESKEPLTVQVQQCRRLAQQALQQYMASTQRQFVFMNLRVGSESPQKVLIELFTELCPRTCENFRALCTGELGSSSSGTRLHYKNSLLHRVVRDGWLQAGDICSRRGDGGESVYGPFFEDESFTVKHVSHGIVGMANCGTHKNHSQFYVTLKELPFFDNKFVAFGRVISGFSHLVRISELETANQRPLQLVTIHDCGQVDPSAPIEE